MTKVVNMYKEPYDVYIGRKGKDQDGYFGNPFPLKDGEDRGATIERYREYFTKRIETDKEFKLRVESLKGKTLGCFCKPQACHGDVIKEYLDGMQNKIVGTSKCGMRITEEGVAKAIDLESSDLLANMLDYSEFPYKLRKEAKLWCISIRDIYSDKVVSLVGSEITKERLEAELKGCKYLIHHNGIKFDLLVLKLFGVLDYTIGYLNTTDTLYGNPVTMGDTLIISRLLSPDRFGGHSLKEWGTRTGYKKTNFRQICVEKGYIEKNSPKGSEFKQFCPEMVGYCEDDTMVTKNTFLSLMDEIGEYKGWRQAIKMENKLADLAVRRESLGFWFDKDLAIKCVEDLTHKMEELQNKVNPILPPKPMTKGELNNFTPPTTQFLKSGKPSTHIIKFAERIGGQIVENEDQEYFIQFENKEYQLPFNLPLKTHVEADISNLDHVKMTLTDVYNWIPTEWAFRDFTKDSKKQSLTYEKRVAAFERWLKETLQGKYTNLRLTDAFKTYKVKTVEDLEVKVKERLREEYPVRLNTSPKVRVGLEKELCPNLIKLGDKVDFAKDFALFLTYKHRKSCIAGGELEDVDYDDEYPTSGYLSAYREQDGRIPTPAIEIGASTSRYRHILVSNVARSTSIYGKEMRSLFGCGKGFVQTAFDFSSLEARVQGHYCFKYPEGEELSKSLVAEKPNDIHSVNSRKLGIERGTVKSVAYAILYGCSPKKLEDMLSYSEAEAKQFYDNYWDAVPALRDLKKAVESFWDNNGKTWLPGIDGRKLNTRSKHSLINLLFQSCGVIAAKYVTVFLIQDMEAQGYCTDPFIGKPDVCSMIEYHDENQLLTSPKLHSFKVFSTEEEAKLFASEWDVSEGQLSAIGHSEKGYYVSLPNVVSIGIDKAIRKAESLLSINVPLGFEWITGKNWLQCH